MQNPPVNIRGTGYDAAQGTIQLVSNSQSKNDLWANLALRQSASVSVVAL